MNKLNPYIPGIAVGLAALYLLVAALPRHTSVKGFNLNEFGKLPVQEGGRVKPMDTLARSALMVISGRQDFLEKDGSRQPAVKWLLDVLVTTPGKVGPAWEHKTFRIDNDQVLNFLGLRPRTGFTYAITEFVDKIAEFDDQVKVAEQKRHAKQEDLFDVKVLELSQYFTTFMKLATYLEPGLIPPQAGESEWMGVREAKRQAVANEDENPLFMSYLGLLDSYAKGDAEKFNAELKTYRKELERLSPQSLPRSAFEAFFNSFAPFYHCAILYGVMLVLVLFSWLAYSGPLNRAAFWLGVLILVVHTGALIGRIYLMGRPPVTSLYSSAVFIGWGCVALNLFLERLFPTGISSSVASVTGMATLIIAHNLAGGDTMEPIVAVLATNFWLATHVICVTLGYTATFVAGFLGMKYILLGRFTDMLRKDGAANLAKMIYGVVCFATMLSFIGTVLGGIWADQSWGRFWGWDPKENGALLIVIWNALLLHARWAGMIKQRGMACLAVGGNIVTAWSWFGTNMLGVGLHAYGFIPAAVAWMIVFVISQLVVIGLGLMPLEDWMSFQKGPPAPPSGPRDLPPRQPVPKTAITASS